jgi:formate-dependent phosphoribosylglycinamide formyltransferase (GAR transformylase)
MRHIVFVAPFPMPATMRFAQALAGLADVRLTGVFQTPPPAGSGFAAVERVSNALDPAIVQAAVTRLSARHGRVHRLLGILENAQDCLAAVREALGIPGVDRETARRFRDKGVMKDALRAAGLPCARHARIRSEADAWAFVERVGYPIVIKPPAGAGCRATLRADHPQGLVQALSELRPSPDREAIAEEFLTGAEFSFETLTLGGQVRFHSIGRYHPAPLEVMTNSWIQWVVHLPRDISGPEFAAVREVGPAVIAALGLDTALTHMEWFRRPDGSVAIGEIAARPPGARIMDLMSHAYGRDFYRVWARLMVDDVVDGPFARTHSVAVAFLRGQGTGRVAAVEGLDAAQQKMGALVVDKQLPRVGAPRAEGYEGEGWVIVKHEDDEVVRRAVMDLITTVKVRYA